MKKLLTTFPSKKAFEDFLTFLQQNSFVYEIIAPPRQFRYISAPAVALTEAVKAIFYQKGGGKYVISGWVDFNEKKIDILEEAPREFEDDIFGTSVIVVLAPCIADRTKLRLITHISKDISEVFPFINSNIRRTVYNHNAKYLCFSEGYRRITLYSRRIALAKVDDIFDAWRILETIRRLVNDTWSDKNALKPDYETRKKPAVLDIFKCLPRTNCRKCGYPTCLAFAVNLHAGDEEVIKCEPVFMEEFIYLQPDLLEICAGL